MNTNLSDNIEYFKNTTNSYRELGIEFDCHPDSIRYFYKKNGISKKTKVVPITLTEEDYEYIKSNFNTMSILAIAKNLNSTEKVLRRACQDLNLKKDGKHIISNLSDKMYTEDNIQFIKYNIDKGIEFLSKELNRTEASIKKKLWELKIPYASATSWSEQEICFLKKNYLLGEGTMSFMLDRSYKSVKHMINTLNLTVTDNKKTENEITDQKIKPYSHAKDKGNDHIVMKRPIVHPSSFNVSINATYGISWISFQVDKNPIRKMTLKKGSNIILKGESIKLVLGNYKALIIKNNKEVVPVKKNINGDIAKINFPQDKNDFSPAQKLIFTLESKVNDQAQRL